VWSGCDRVKPTVYGRSGHQLRTPRTRIGDRRHLAGRVVATLPTHYAATLMTITPKTSWPWVRTLLHSIYDQPDADSVVARYDRSLSL
jgi:hypothetical protein